MMAVILNSAMLDSDTLFSSLRFTQKHSHSTLTLTQTNSIWLKLIHSHSTCHLEFHHLGFSHLSFSSQTHSHLPRLVPTICTKKTFTHSFWLNLMMAAILNSAMLDSDTLFSSLRFTQKHSHSTLTLTQTHSIWLKLIHSHSTWWWQPSWIPAILDSATLVFPLKLTHTCQDWFPPFAQKRLHSFILTQPFAQKMNSTHVGFRHCNLDSWQPSWSSLMIGLKNTSLIDSDSTWWWQPSWINLPCWLPSWILTILDSAKTFLHSDSGSNLFNLTQTHSFSLNLMMVPILNLTIMDSATLVFPLKLTHICQDWFPPFAQKRLHSQPFAQKNFTHSFWLNLMMAVILNSTMLDSDTLISSLRFTQKHSHSTLTLDSN